MFRFWLFMAGLCNTVAVLAGIGGSAAGVNNGGMQFAVVGLILFLLSIPLLSIAALLASTEGRRRAPATWLVNVSAAAFLVSVVLFSFLSFPMVETFYPRGPDAPVLVAQVNGLVRSNFIILSRVAGGIFLFAWVALAVSAFGFRRGEDISIIAKSGLPGFRRK